MPICPLTPPLPRLYLLEGIHTRGRLCENRWPFSHICPRFLSPPTSPLIVVLSPPISPLPHLDKEGLHYGPLPSNTKACKMCDILGFLCLFKEQYFHNRKKITFTYGFLAVCQLCNDPIQRIYAFY